jgi:hypothetical protein
MKNRNKIIIIVATTIVFIFVVMYINNYINIQKAKYKLLEEQSSYMIQEAKAQAEKKSDIEILEMNAAEMAATSKVRLNDIESLKEEIAKLEKLYEVELLSQRCYESQIDRKIN